MAGFLAEKVNFDRWKWIKSSMESQLLHLIKLFNHISLKIISIKCSRKKNNRELADWKCSLHLPKTFPKSIVLGTTNSLPLKVPKWLLSYATHPSSLISPTLTCHRKLLSLQNLSIQMNTYYLEAWILLKPWLMWNDSIIFVLKQQRTFLSVNFFHIT